MTKDDMQSVVDVAVAVIHFGDNYLLGFRNASQHQGNRYEFIGGKIEAKESPKQGLVREVAEEIGLDISQNLAIKMGVIRHDYADKGKLEKSVALHIFKVGVIQAQFDSLQSEQGAEGQAITWVNKTDLLANKYPLPDANARILDWLTLHDTIFISQSLANFRDEPAFIDFYIEKLPQNAFFYHRPQTDNSTNFLLIENLLKHRADLTPIIQWQIYHQLIEKMDLAKAMVHLNHQQLITLDFGTLPKELRYFASCHDKNSLSKINELAKSHTVMGCFLSPVKATPTHPNEQGMGWQAFGELAEFSDVPVFALGGVEQDDLPIAWEHGAVGVAGIRLISV